MHAYPDTQLLIDGEWRASKSGRTLPVVNPATAKVIGHVAWADTDDLDQALDAAVRGFGIWRATSAHERARLMRRAAEILRSRADEIATWMTLEQGKPLEQSRLETLAGADIIDWFAGEAQRTYGQIIPGRAPDVIQMTLKLPVGPVAAFTPWNFPINQVVRKLSAALAAGCSIIVKAAEETPASPAALINAFVDAGIPRGVVNLVYGVPADISGYLIPHPAIRKISFTGSTPVGKTLAALAGLHMKRATMELGGHAPVIVAEDADVDEAARVMVAAKFRNAGQICVAPTRFLVHDSVADHFTERFAEGARAIRVGDGLDSGVGMGPLANERRIPALEALINDATTRNAKLVTGGRRIGNEGWFFEPTVLADVPTDARIMNEEPFGPVAIINRFDTLDAAIEEANRLPYGLAAFGFTRSSATATRLGNEVVAGMMSINHYGLALPEVPFGGTRDSGYGTEGGSEALEAYLDTRLVTRKG
ncbi:aldehyde dehydrogenase [Hoeflea sp. BAL378]|uniref:NAD-dependent succinate-semialdehyde dehydrogenase n=1 Tax=Hoeflea sp. BAL378 TaxID=1547437 RepID=UPI000513C103|nr:NAD-dependent succinate-semialdehyde dehydrogenase [Hoeflea sp. BAL378]KGF69469.1 aldehyde dehydrogenase [Hoeflea sp. BAL378]